MSGNPEISPAPLRWAIVGPGRVAHKFARDLAIVEGGVLEAVVGRSPERARAFAAMHGARRVLDGEAALAADPGIDLVYIASPHPSHFETAKRLLLAGKSVLCEKPLALNAGQARELIRVSREKRVFLMEALWSRFLPVYRQVRTWLDEERIGVPRLVTSAFCADLPADPLARWFNPKLAGGGLLDLGVYNLALTRFVMKEQPEEIAALATFSETGVDEMLSVSMRYRHGAMAQFVCAMKGIHDNALVIGGDKGFIRVPSRFINAGEATLAVGAESVTVKTPLRGQGFEYEIEEAMRCFRAGEIESPLMPHADTLATLETMDRLRLQIGLRYPGETGLD